MLCYKRKQQPHLLCCSSKHVGCGGVHVGIADVSTGPGGYGAAIEGAGTAGHTHPALAGDGLINNAQHRLAIVQQRNQGAEEGLPCRTTRYIQSSMWGSMRGDALQGDAAQDQLL